MPRTVRLPVVDEETAAPLWFEHPILRRTADIAALRLPAELFPNVYVVNNDIVMGNDGNPSEKQPLIFEGTDVYILGYPRGISAGENLPVWKRASIASALGIPIDGAPKFLVDSTTSEGLSGAPVIFRSNIYPVEGAAGLLGTLQTAVGGTAQVFLGIYSGRDRRLIDDDRVEQVTAQLGYVWQRTAVDELLASAAAHCRD